MGIIARCEFIEANAEKAIGRYDLSGRQTTMSDSSTTILGIKGTSPDPAYLCDAMFMAGARGLGLSLDEEVPPEALEKIIEAAAMLVERLRHILKMTTSGGEELEIRN